MKQTLGWNFDLTTLIWILYIYCGHMIKLKTAVDMPLIYINGIYFNDCMHIDYSTGES